MKLFISYSSKDRSLVNDLRDELELMGFTVWYDQTLLRRGGHKWWTDIMAALRDADVFIYAASPNLIASIPCGLEYGYAVYLGKPILPLQIADLNFRDLPAEIRNTEIVDVRHLHEREQRRNLRASLEELPPAPPIPTDAKDHEPPIPPDPLAEMLDQVKALTTDTERQHLLIIRIDDYHADHGTSADLLLVLERLIDRDDVLTVRNLKRAKDLLTRIGEVEAETPSATPSSVPSPRITIADLPRPAPEPEHKAGDRWIDPHDVPMVYVPAGSFLMGSTEKQVKDAFAEAKREDAAAEKEWFTDQLPQHSQTIAQPFWLDLTPVTNAQYARFVQDGGYVKEAYWTPPGWAWVQKKKKKAPTEYKDESSAPNQPRVGVTWFEAAAYAAWRGGRLPTEAEWEWAARGPQSLIYPWGNTFDGTKSFTM